MNRKEGDYLKTHKPRCYLVKRCMGRYMLEYVYNWLALDEWQHEVARAKTEEECKKKAKEAGYIPR